MWLGRSSNDSCLGSCSKQCSMYLGKLLGETPYPCPPPTYIFLPLHLSPYVGIILFVLINNLIGAFRSFNSCFNNSFLIDGKRRGGRSRGILCKVQKLVSNVTGLIHGFEFT